jgi:hypothetical protein
MYRVSLAASGLQIKGPSDWALEVGVQLRARFLLPSPVNAYSLISRMRWRIGLEALNENGDLHFLHFGI